MTMSEPGDPPAPSGGETGFRFGKGGEHRGRTAAADDQHWFVQPEGCPVPPTGGHGGDPGAADRGEYDQEPNGRAAARLGPREAEHHAASQELALVRTYFARELPPS